MLHRSGVLLALAVLLLTLSIFPQPAVGQEGRHQTGLVLVGDLAAPRPMPEALAKAWSDASRLSRAHPHALGYPWADAATGTLVVSVARDSGDAVAQQWTAAGMQLQVSAGKQRTLSAPTVPVQVRRVTRSWSQLEDLKHGVTMLEAQGVQDAHLIYASEPDYAQNRVIVTIERLSDRLMRSLASRYGNEALAVRVARQPENVGPNRHADTSPFYGGARISSPIGCTSGFSWESPGNYMLYAGHCAPTGGSVSTPAAFMGTVTSDSRENWTSGTGTVYFTGQNVYRGDLALIDITTGSSIAGRIYTGTKDSENSAPVKEMWYRSPAVGDQYCQAGHSSGELCGYSVQRVAFDYRYPATGEWVRNINEGTKGDPCHGAGDSGGPVYTVRGDGGIAAKGIHSGGGSFLGTCYEYFTDIWEAWEGLPGTLKTS